MIDPKELMINDWVSTPIGVAQVSELHHNTVIVDKNVSAFYEVVEPIPLTDEMLKLNGFKEKKLRDRWFWMINFPFNIEHTTNKELYYVMTNNIVIRGIFYVHELQHFLRLACLNEKADNFKLE